MLFTSIILVRLPFGAISATNILMEFVPMSITAFLFIYLIPTIRFMAFM